MHLDVIDLRKFYYRTKLGVFGRTEAVLRGRAGRRAQGARRVSGRTEAVLRGREGRRAQGAHRVSGRREVVLRR